MTLDRVKESLRVLVGALQPIDYLALYPAKVVSQNADKTLELIPDDTRFKGIKSVPIRLGLPGCSVDVAGGSRVLLGFEAGDPSRPVATLWQQSVVTELRIGNSPTSYLALATQTKAALDAIVAWANSHTHVVPAAPGTSNVGLPSLSTSTAVASATVKST